MARRSWLRDGDAELEQLLRRVDRMITTAAREQTLDSIRRFAATLLRQGFLVTEDFMRQLAQLAQAKDKRLDARTFADEFYTTRHYRLVGPAYALRLVRVRDIPILYRLGGVNGAPIILMGILPTGAAVRMAAVVPPPHDEPEAEFGNLFYGCTPCISGWQICRKRIVPDDGSCIYIGWDTYRCRC